MSTEFKSFILHNRHAGFIPANLELRLPESELPESLQHFLLEIPWSERYLDQVPVKYRSFFNYVLPLLHARTTDVHTAVCLGIMPELFQLLPSTDYSKINQRVVAIGLILHDSGWSKLTQDEIASSLGVSGLKLTSNAMGPKEKHAIESEKIAREILAEYSFDPQLTQQEIELICQAVLYHDKPEQVAGAENPLPLEVKLLVDLDHIWSFTYHNFWQDTLRKGVDPRQYLSNLENDVESYFVTNQGKALARKYLSQRRKEIELLLAQTLD